jgi:hypothetical protein
MPTLQKMFSPQKDSPVTYTLGALAPTDTFIMVQSPEQLPIANMPFPLTLGVDRAVTETVLVTAANGQQLTVQRGFQGAALNWPAETQVARTFNAGDLQTLQNNIISLGKMTAVPLIEGVDYTKEQLQNVFEQHVNEEQFQQSTSFVIQAAFTSQFVPGKVLSQENKSIYLPGTLSLADLEDWTAKIVLSTEEDILQIPLAEVSHESLALSDEFQPIKITGTLHISAPSIPWTADIQLEMCQGYDFINDVILTEDELCTRTTVLQISATLDDSFFLSIFYLSGIDPSTEQEYENLIYFGADINWYSPGQEDGAIVTQTIIHVSESRPNSSVAGIYGSYLKGARFDGESNNVQEFMGNTIDISAVPDTDSYILTSEIELFGHLGGAAILEAKLSLGYDFIAQEILPQGQGCLQIIVKSISLQSGERFTIDDFVAYFPSYSYTMQNGYRFKFTLLKDTPVQFPETIFGKIVFNITGQGGSTKWAFYLPPTSRYDMLRELSSAAFVSAEEFDYIVDDDPLAPSNHDEWEERLVIEQRVLSTDHIIHLRFQVNDSNFFISGIESVQLYRNTLLLPA